MVRGRSHHHHHRRGDRIVGWLSGLAIASLVTAGSAGAAAPVNDNYLSSAQMMDGQAVTREFSDAVDTSGATIQADLFQPDREGMPLGGGPAESTRCNETQFGATVWYAFAPEIAGSAEIVAGGYDTVVSVYEYAITTAKIIRTITCSNKPAAAETVVLSKVEKGHAYTIQVGGSGAATGMLDFKFNFFGDRDEDGVFDETPDKCPGLPGIKEEAGCPAELRTSLRTAYRDAPGGPRLTKVVLLQVPIGALVEARCRRCGTSQTLTARSSVVSLSKFAGRLVPAGAKLEVFVTRSRTKSGRFRRGTIGNYFSLTARAVGFARREDRCLLPGSTMPRKRCT